MNKFKVMHLLSFSRDRCSRTYNYYARHFDFVLLQTSFYDESTNCKVANSERKNKNLVFIYCFKNELHFARDWHNETKKISLKWFCFFWNVIRYMWANTSKNKTTPSWPLATDFHLKNAFYLNFIQNVRNIFCRWGLSFLLY